VNLFNYAGFVIGAGLIGAVAELASLRLAFVVPALLTTVIVLFAKAFESPAAAQSWTPAAASAAADVQDLPDRT
jgi:hypothetical protein